jgi:aminopeptidase N/diadenosine tetraphosphate (Ap4A) HIT family hydrolase
VCSKKKKNYMTSFVDTLFQKIVAGEIPSYKVYEDDLTYAFLDINPLSLGHTLVIPKKKYTRFTDVPTEVAKALGRSVNLVAKAVAQATGCEDFNILQNNGKDAHQEVPHCHFHIIPKTDSSSGLIIQWPASKNNEPEDIQAKIVQAIADIQLKSSGSSEHRLPTIVQPRNYKLTLKPDLTAFTFDGVVDIECDVRESTSVIVLHAKELEVTVATCMQCSTGNSSTAATIVLNEKNDQLTLTFETPIQKGAMTLSLTFTGILNDKMCGFYRSTYKSADDDTEKIMATTQFEATDARRAFPCWDEPAFKATFDMTMVVKDKTLTSLSNMPIKSTTDLGENGMEYTYFRSPVMSTYLLAFIIGDLESISGKTASGTEVNVYCTPGKTSQCAFALETGIKVLDFFTEYFGLGYPLPKCDMVGIPDFASGAMENWGLITYRETALFANDDSSAAAKQRVAYVVAHELAHQWFGNLVTMEWWSDLWLNEGFATWAGTLAVDHVFPHWDTWTQFSQDDGSYALSTDALLSSHPIQINITDPAMIDQVI